MSKYKTFIVFLILTAIWASFFSSVKFFLWWDLSSSLNVNLQTISAFLALGSFFAYFIGWALAYTFLEKYLLFAISILTTIFISLWYFIWFDSKVFFIFVIIFVWIFYWLWASVKNIVISIEIRKTMLPDTMVSAYSSVIFFFFIIIWSIFWNYLYESLWHDWYILIMYIPLLSAIFSLMLNYEKVSLQELIWSWYKAYFFDRRHKFVNAMKEYIPAMKFIFKKYYIILFTSAILWTSSAILYQQMLEYSISYFSIKASSASFIFLFSAIWLMIWNLLSIKMNNNRWTYFLFSNIILSLLIVVLPFFFINLYFIFFIVFFVAIFFWISINLIDSFFFKSIWDDFKKEYWASVYWIVFSIVIFIMMFLAIFINWLLWINFLSLILSLLIIISSFITYIKFDIKKIVW